jgi:hypothetical protein
MAKTSTTKKKPAAKAATKNAAPVATGAMKKPAMGLGSAGKKAKTATAKR